MNLKRELVEKCLTNLLRYLFSTVTSLSPVIHCNRFGVDAVLWLLVCKRLDYIQLSIAMVVALFDTVARDKLARLPFRD